MRAIREDMELLLNGINGNYLRNILLTASDQTERVKRGRCVCDGKRSAMVLSGVLEISEQAGKLLEVEPRQHDCPRGDG